MPRPLKMVSPDTLGGRIRAARQALGLSLSEVAGKEYSTSLISQIERNKIEPSAESLKYLAGQLRLPLDDLMLLAQEHRDTEAETLQYTKIEEQRALAAQLLESNHALRALEHLQNVNIVHIPIALRWRIIALRGQCYFAMREFLAAQQEFRSAFTVMPDYTPPEQYMEVLLLRLHLAAASRELGQYETAYKQFQDARAMMNATTPLRYVAEAHWGISLVLYEQANKLWNDAENGNGQKQQAKERFMSLMQQSLKYAENACSLYNSIDELSRSALMNCQIALIEQATENPDAARERLKNVLDSWSPTLIETEQARAPDIAKKIKRYSLKERANIVSAASCYMASVEYDAKQCSAALAYIDKALEAGKNSYILRRADAYMTKGQILAECNDPEAAVAFRQALTQLEHTDRLGAKIRIHRMLGAYLIKQGKDREGNTELDIALRLANVPSQYQASAEEEEISANK
ncbi:MAG TPA: helix-turn-helix transcriptional regulator [Ktedonobacteraceae bacterium]|nr:helix-turn-helix transcriptional regulator [Ktedonobacteraceae bacterium]